MGTTSPPKNVHQRYFQQRQDMWRRQNDDRNLVTVRRASQRGAAECQPVLGAKQALSNSTSTPPHSGEPLRITQQNWLVCDRGGALCPGTGLNKGITLQQKDKQVKFNIMLPRTQC